MSNIEFRYGPKNRIEVTRKRYTITCEEVCKTCNGDCTLGTDEVCFECEGEGVIVYQVELRDVLEEMGVFRAMRELSALQNGGE